MVAFADAAVGRLVAQFRRQAMWNDTLFIYASDNVRLPAAAWVCPGTCVSRPQYCVAAQGGPSYLNGTSGGNNFPLKGG
jgi:hypothetical protein